MDKLFCTWGTETREIDKRHAWPIGGSTRACKHVSDCRVRVGSGGHNTTNRVAMKRGGGRDGEHESCGREGGS